MSDIGKVLKQSRISSGLTVQQVSEIMLKRGYEKASPKTIYSWESGNSKPTPDYFMELCNLYQIEDILSEFGYKKIESPSENDELSASLALFQSLSPEKRLEVMHYMEFLISLERE